MLAAGLAFLWANGAIRPAGEAVLAGLAVLVALALIFAPSWRRLARSLAAEKAERIRSQERADVGAHLHDSVLQTLALIQQSAKNPKQVATLARRQERELRNWLTDGNSIEAGDRLAAALEAAAAEVEEAAGGTVEVVAVGDCPLDEPGAAVVAAAREAMLNAAKFAGKAPVFVYAELSDERIQVFVRDRGAGFDPTTVPAARRGVRESIVGRMRRAGGRAVVRPSPGGGTEVEITVGRGVRAVSGGSNPRVLIVDDHALFRAGVREGLGEEIEVVGESGEVDGAVRAIEELEPDVVLLDVHMPGGGGVEVIRRVAESRPAVRFLALSVSDAAEDVIAVIRAGARGYVTKTISGPELTDAVRRVRDGDAVFSPRLAGFVLDTFAGEIPRLRWTRSWTC